MAQEELEIEISPDGKVTVRTVGIKGKRCLDAVGEIAEIIGKIQEQEMTAEYYEAETEISSHTSQHRHIRRGE